MAAEKVAIGELAGHVGRDVTLSGWLYNSRASGKIQFLIVRDGTGLCQCVVEKGKVSDEVEERSVGGHELAVTAAEVVSPAVDYPITPKSHGIDFLLKNRHLHLRSQLPWCIGKVRHTVI
ncbi:MAG: OB-fold nucleic acid binding domain-containing protein, partial [Planctomycetota bacterium]